MYSQVLEMFITIPGCVGQRLGVKLAQGLPLKCVKVTLAWGFHHDFTMPIFCLILVANLENASDRTQVLRFYPKCLPRLLSIRGLVGNRADSYLSWNRGTVVNLWRYSTLIDIRDAEHPGTHPSRVHNTIDARLASTLP